jgi:hypothetical protein
MSEGLVSCALDALIRASVRRILDCRGRVEDLRNISMMAMSVLSKQRTTFQFIATWIPV